MNDDSATPRTDREVYRITAANLKANEGFEVVNPALSRMLERELGQATDLLGRIRAWDMLDHASDGPYWRGEIEAALAKNPAATVIPRRQPAESARYMPGDSGEPMHGDGTLALMSAAWHIRLGQYGRAFYPAPGPLLAVALWLRGWRPFQNMSVSPGRWWSKPSRNTRAMYPMPHVIWWDGNPRRKEPKP